MVALACHAMATRFEIVLHGGNPTALRAAGEAALEEIHRLEAQLSLYQPTSEISRVNSLAARQPVRVSPPVFHLLQHAAELHRLTSGAFDITIAPLVRCWGFMNSTGSLPSLEQLTRAGSLTGMHHVILNAENFSVRFDREGVMLDLGAIGKGYAIDCAVRILRESGVASALIHSGTSTTYALGHPPDADSWKIAIATPPVPNPNPNHTLNPKLITQIPPQTPATSDPLAPPAGKGATPLDSEATLSNLANPNLNHNPAPTFLLRDEALSVSAGWGKSFVHEGKTYGHVLDPRTGEPVSGNILAAVALPSATETDALSTALLVAGEELRPSLTHARPAIRTLLIKNKIETVDPPLKNPGTATTFSSDVG
jgi:thiamine biosynthesis lipoprotein